MSRVALVTGGSRGIGRAVAIELAGPEWTIAIVHRADETAAARTADEIRARGAKAATFRVDVSDDVRMRDTIASIEETLGAIEILVCAAGLTRDTLLGSSAPDDFDALHAVNVQGVVNVCRHVSLRMMRRRRGSIVTISSVAAQRPGRGQSSYAATKGAIESFTRALAVELAPRGIRVNAVAPGVIATDMTADLRAIAPGELERRILLKRPGTPEEVAAVVSFLAGDRASYVTGQIWNVDGGFKLE